MKLIEKILIGLVALAFLLRVFFIPGGTVLQILSIMTLATLWFAFSWWAFAYGSKKEENYENNMGLSIGIGISLSILATGILFKLMFWPGAFVELAFGLVITGALFIPVIIFNAKGEKLKKYYNTMLLRLSISIFIGLILLYTPSLSLYSFFHRNDPIIIEKWKNYQDNPDSEEAFNDYFNYVESK